MRVIISLNAEYRIELDAFSWQLSKWKPRNNHSDGGVWEGVSWHRTLQQAGEAARQRFVAEDDMEDVQEIIDAIRSSSLLISNAIIASGILDSWSEAKHLCDGFTHEAG